MKRWGIIAAVGVLAAVAAVAAAGGYLLLHNSSPIPAPIAKQLTFSAVLPKQKELVNAQVDPSSYKYDSSNKLLTFVVNAPGYSVVMSEQAYPEVLIYDKLVNGLNPYDEVDTKQGKVTLTRPNNLNGGQAAVANPQGLLIFAKPSRDLNKDEWQRFFNSLAS